MESSLNASLRLLSAIAFLILLVLFRPLTAGAALLFGGVVNTLK